MSRPALFLDRDGTIVHDPGYLHRPADVRLLEGAGAALRRAQDAGYALVVVTNQSGIGRGRYDEAAFRATQAEVERQLAGFGVRLDGTWHCPHAPDAACLCRKPGTALHRDAAVTLGLDPRTSWCIGDRDLDVLAADALGARSVLVRTGDGARHADAVAARGIPVTEDLAAAIAFVLQSPPD